VPDSGSDSETECITLFMDEGDAPPTNELLEDMARVQQVWL
jgi:hypothetical protein